MSERDEVLAFLREWQRDLFAAQPPKDCVAFVPIGLYQRAIREGFITADDPRWRPAKPLPV